MYKLEIKLKQHTPLIHFQHDQEGATLRASEVKPKLDRFIISKLKENHKSYKHLLTGNGEHEALDYKLKIKSGPLSTIGISDRYPLFFANMGDSERKEFRFCEDYIYLIFQSFEEEIQFLLKEFLLEFIISNNFGTRQSKGFGSFYIADSDPLYKSPLQTQLMDYRFKAEVSGDLSNQWKQLFEHIELFYKVLRSGINICNRDGNSIFYMKSIMFKYAKEKGLQWDKKSIKEAYYPRILQNQQTDHSDTEIADNLHFSQNISQKYLFKDLLGLSSSESWRSPYRIQINKDNPIIDRFKSPIIFKPIRKSEKLFEIFFKGDTIPKDYLDKDFQIKKGSERPILTLKTYPKFDIDEFLDYAIFEVDLEELVGNEDYINHSKFRQIEKIFNQIRRDYE